MLIAGDKENVNESLKTMFYKAMNESIKRFTRQIILNLSRSYQFDNYDFFIIFVCCKFTTHENVKKP